MKRIAPGYYNEEINGHDVVVMHNELTGFWQLVVDEEWWQSFCTKRECLQAVDTACDLGEL